MKNRKIYNFMKINIVEGLIYITFVELKKTINNYEEDV